MTLRIVILCSIIIHAISCNKANSDLSYLLRAPSNTPKDSIEISFSQDVRLNLYTDKSEPLTLLRPFLLDNKYLYGILRKKPHDQLLCFDLDRQKFVSSISLTSDEVRDAGVNSFYVHSTDSIFFQTSNSAKIILIDSLGKTLLIKEASPDHTFVFPSFMPEHRGYFDQPTNTYYSTVVPVGYFNTFDERFDTYRFQGIFRMDKLVAPTRYAPLEGVMKQKVNSFYPPDLSVPYNLILGNKAFVTYPMDHYIYIYDLKTLELMDKRATSSSVKVDLLKPIPKELIDSRQEIWNFRITSSFYEPLFYHPKVKLFTRAIHMQQDLKLENGKLNTGKKRMTAVLILNEELETVGQTIFNNGIYTIHGAVPLADGLLLQSFEDITGGLHYRKYSFKLRQ